MPIITLLLTNENSSRISVRDKSDDYLQIQNREEISNASPEDKIIELLILQPLITATEP